MIKKNRKTEPTSESLFPTEVLSQIKELKLEPVFDTSSQDAKHEICKYQGTKYVFPKNSGKYSHFNTIKITSQCNLFNLYSKSLYLDTEISKFLNLTISLSDNEFDFELNSGFVYIYRMGESNPIAHKECEEYGEITMTFDLNLFTPGEYFLVISNFTPLTPTEKKLFNNIDNRYIYHFCVYNKSTTNEIPPIKGIKTPIKPLPTSYTDTPLAMTFQLKNPISGLKKYEIVCIDENSSVISTCDGSIKENKRSFNIVIEPKLLWKPGTYNVYCQINGIPFYKVTFDITDQEEITFDWGYISSTSDDYRMCKAMLNPNTAWQNLISKPGTKSLQMAVKDYFPLAEINKKQKERLQSTCSFGKNYTIATENESYDEDILKDFILSLNNTDNFRFDKRSCENLGKPKEQSLGTSYNEEDYEVTLYDDSCLCLTDIQELSSPYSTRFVDNLFNEISQHRNFSLLIVGTERQINSVFEAHPRLKDCFPKSNRLKIESLAVEDVATCIFKQIKILNITMSDSDKTTFIKKLFLLAKEGKLKRLSEKDINRIVSVNIVTRFTERIRSEAHDASNEYQIVCNLSLDDIDMSLLTNTDSEVVDYATEIHNMIGLNNLKESLHKMFNLTKFNHMRHSLGLKADDNGSHHMIFTGNPGTGKTTVARLIGKAFHSIGILSKGDVIITERSKIVGRYLGETEHNMNELLEQAKGNVLFIDEAYTLSTDADDNRDFGRRVIETLLTVLSQKNPDMIIIFAGYENEINRMLSINPGLNGRFPHRFKFEDYSAHELELIAEKLIENEQYKLTDDARTRLSETIAEYVSNKGSDFSNARWVNQYVTNGIIPEVANRLMNIGGVIDYESCQTITLDDINSAYKNHKLSLPKRSIDIPKVGFKTA